MEPTLAVNGLGRLLWHVLGPAHRQEAPITELAALSNRDDLTRRRVDDLDVDMGQRFADRRRFQLEWIIRQRRGNTATAFGLSKNDGGIGPDALFHLLDQRAGKGSSAAGDCC